jgi:hypothetical protein
VSVVSQKLIDVIENSYITPINLSKIIKKEKNMSNSQFEKDESFIKNNNKIVYDHRVLIEGGDEKGNLVEFSTITSKSTHAININNLNDSKNEIIGIMPTIKAPEEFKLSDGFKFEYNSLVKHKSQFDILLEKSNLNELSKSFSLKIKSSKEGVMEQLG